MTIIGRLFGALITIGIIIGALLVVGTCTDVGPFDDGDNGNEVSIDDKKADESTRDRAVRVLERYLDDDNVSTGTLRTELRAEGIKKDDANKIASAVTTARDDGGATMQEIVDEVDKQPDDDADDVVNGAKSAASKAAKAKESPTPGKTPVAANAEQIKAEILAEVDRKIAQAQGDAKRLLEDLRKEIAAARAATVADLRETFRRQIESVSRTTTVPPSSGQPSTTKSDCSTNSPNIPCVLAQARTNGFTPFEVDGKVIGGPAEQWWPLQDDRGNMVPNSYKMVGMRQTDRGLPGYEMNVPEGMIMDVWLKNPAFTNNSNSVRLYGPANINADFRVAEATLYARPSDFVQSLSGKWARRSDSKNLCGDFGPVGTVPPEIGTLHDCHQATTSPGAPSSTTAAFNCSNPPKSPANLVKVFPESKGGTWSPTGIAWGWFYTGPAIALTAVDGVHHIDNDAGQTTAGQTTPSRSPQTVWFCE